MGRELGVPTDILQRHPFPGPGLAVRILGDITPERLTVLREADRIFREEIKAAGIYNEIWQAFAAQAQRKALAVEFDLPPDATIESDRALLRIIVRNFLSNAAEYAPENGEIRIAVIPQGGAVTLRIANTAADLSPADLPHIFERFWRKTNARTSSTRAGLGLSISRAAAQLLGAELHAEIPEPGRFAISLMLPAARRLESQASAARR